MIELVRMPYPVLFATALLVSAGLTPLFRQLALRTMVFVQRPKTISIETHVRPTPVGGGLAIFLSVVGALWLTRAWSSFEQRILLAGAILAVFGMLDDSRVLTIPHKLGGKHLAKFLLDNRALSTSSKFVAQFLVATLLVMWPGMGGPLAVPHLFKLQAINQILAVIWIVGMMNAINFLDIMDGLAAGASAVAALGFFLLAGYLGAGQAFTALAVAVVGGALGFLLYNFQPARIFMGDTGSQFLGLVLATLALRVASTPTSLARILPPLILLGIPLFEIAFTMTIRLLTGQAPWKGSKDHYPLRMFQLGYSVRQIVVATYLAGFGLILCAIFLVQGQSQIRLLVIVLLALSALGFGRWISRVKVERGPARGETPRPALSAGEPTRDDSVRVERHQITYPTGD